MVGQGRIKKRFFLLYRNQTDVLFRKNKFTAVFMIATTRVLRVRRCRIIDWGKLTVIFLGSNCFYYQGSFP